MSQLLKELQELKLKKIILFLTPILLLGCQGYSITGGPGPLVSDPLKVSSSPGLKAQTAKSILVFPLSGGVGVELSADDLNSKTKIVQTELEGNSSYTVINNAESKSTLKLIEEARKLKQPLSVQARKAGELAKAPIVLYGTLTRFAPFTGSSAPQSPIKFSGSIESGDFNSPQSDLRGGVASPKSALPGGVGFNLVLISVESGATLWSASFDIQEASVAENIFQIKRQIELGKQAELDQILRLAARSAIKQLELERKASIKR